MTTELLRNEMTMVRTPIEKNNPEQPIFIDENFWGSMLSLYRLRLHAGYGINTIKTIAAVSQVIEELQIPEAETVSKLLLQFANRERDVFSLMLEEPWNINPLAPPTEKESTFVQNIDKLDVGDFQKRRNLVQDFFKSEKNSTAQETLI